MATELVGFGGKKSAGFNDEFSSQIHLQSTTELFKPHPFNRRLVKIIVVILIVLLAAAVGFVIGYFIPKSCEQKTIDDNKGNGNAQRVDYHQRFLNMVDRDEIKKTLRVLTSRPHVSTTPNSNLVGDYFLKTWREYGFQLDVPEYEVPISLPQEDKPNIVTIINNDTSIVENRIIGLVNMTASEDSNTTFKYLPYLAYSPNGTVEGQLVYVGAASKGDLEELERQNITVKGKIALANNLFANVKLIQEYGAIGVILYPDPLYYAPEGHGKNDTYPNSVWLPPDAVQRVSLIPSYGDPYTPFLPSKKGMYRSPDSKVNFLKIPAQTISYHEAEKILRRMGGPKVPRAMKGKLNIEYRFGPLLSSSNTSSVVRLETNNRIQIKTVRNIIATIPGTLEPDRVVLIGNHRDAWTFGASDPSSGSATLKEISRILSILQKQGWKPRRTIKLCSWGGEEMGLFGSYEWVQENDQWIRDQGVAYLNTDVAVGGNFALNVQTGSILHEFILKHIKKIEDPLIKSKTLFDTMLERLSESTEYPGEPGLSMFWYLSDNIPFEHNSGLATVDFSFFNGYKKKIKLYPVYHTQYDTFEWITKFADPDFLHFQSMTQLLGSLLLDLSDNPILPFAIERFGKSVSNAYSRLKYIGQLNFHGMNETLSDLKQSIDEFVRAAKRFDEKKQNLTGSEHPLILRMFNDKMANIPKTFLSPYTVNESDGKLVLFNEMFSNINNVISTFKNRKNDTEQRDSALRFQFSILIQIVRAASSLLVT